MNTLVIIIIAIIGIAIYFWVDKFSSSNEVSDKSLDLKTTIQNQDSSEIKIVQKTRIISNKEEITFYINKFYIRLIKEIINLTDTEIKVMSLVIGTSLGLFLGNTYTNKSYHYKYHRPSSYNVDSERTQRVTTISDQSFNWVLGLSMLIITSGIMYLLLNRIKRNSNKK